MVDTERLHTAQLLYNLRDRLDAELALRKHPSTRANVKHAISVIEATADQTMRGLVDLDTAGARSPKQGSSHSANSSASANSATTSTTSPTEPHLTWDNRGVPQRHLEGAR